MSPQSNMQSKSVQYSVVEPKYIPRMIRKSAKTPKRSRFADFWENFWLYEVGACLVSLLFVVAIIVILKKFDNRPLSDWTHSLTINTAISILATALGSTLAVPISGGLGQLKWLWFRYPRSIVDMETFDSATRGPVGALKLLYKLRGLHLGILGSFITIIALSLSPFIQQLIAFQTRDNVLSHNATIPISNLYDVYGGGYHLQPEINMTTQGAVFNGIFNPDPTAIQVKANCNTGNCTFSEPYSSIAVCSACANVTKFIQQNIYYSDQEGNETYSHYNYTLPNGVYIEDQGATYISTSARGDGDNTFWSGFGEPLSVVTVMSSTNDALNDPGYSGIIGPWAAQCLLYVCVNTYTSVVVNGVLEEQTIGTYFNGSAQITEEGYNLTQQPCLADLGYGNSTYAVDENEPEDVIFSSCNYFIPPLVFLAIQEWLPYVFAAGYPLNFDLVMYNNNNNNSNRSNFEFVDKMMARVATSLTTNFRTYGDGPSAFGTSSTPETYISVQWDWIILPAVLVFFSTLFLSATIVKSRGTETWKSSSLALLFSSGVVDERDEIVKLHEIERIAKGRSAILKETAAGSVQLSRDIN